MSDEEERREQEWRKDAEEMREVLQLMNELCMMAMDHSLDVVARAIPFFVANFIMANKREAVSEEEAIRVFSATLPHALEILKSLSCGLVGDEGGIH